MKQEVLHSISVTAAAIAAVALIAGFPALALAEDRATLEPTQIIGNRELPKVLYIVPWKKPLPGDLAGRPVESVLDEALAPVDRDVFRRQVQYDSQVRPVAGVPDAAAGASKATGAGPAHP
jgi:hypothetical protein